MKQHEIPGRIALTIDHGGLDKIKVTTDFSTAEIYSQGAQVTHFQKNGEPPLLFLSAKSHFALGKAIRGGVPICFPWFGPRDGEPAHGFARFTAWELAKTSTTADGTVTLHFRLPEITARPAWKNLRTEFVVTVGETLTMELTATNESSGETLMLENCLHTYFHVGDIGAVTLTGLENAVFDDFASGAKATRKPAEHAPLRITQETNRVYPDHPATVEIHDEKLMRTICVEKFNSHSTVVWNPWTTQKMTDDWGANEHLNMVCVESGNVKQNKISLAPGKTSTLKVVLHSQASK